MHMHMSFYGFVRHGERYRILTFVGTDCLVMRKYWAKTRHIPTQVAITI